MSGTTREQPTDNLKVSMGKIIDGFVMLHYVIKNIHDAKNYNEILRKYLESLVTEGGFKFDSAKLYLFQDKIKEIDLVDDKLNFKTLEKIEDKVILRAIKERLYKTSDDFKRVIMPLESQGSIIGVIAINNSSEISFETLKAIEIFAMQTSTILDLVKLKLNLEKEVLKKTRELSEANTELTKHSEDLENLVEERTKKIKNVQTQMIQKEKLASIGQLAAGVAHELNNPIGFVTGNFTALKDYFNIMKEYIDLFNSLKEEVESIDNDEIKEKITKIGEFEESVDVGFILDDIDMLFEESEEGLTRVTDIVKNLKEFSRIDDEKSEDFNIIKGINNTLIIAKNEYKYCADIKTELNEVPNIKANGGEINEVILNIVVNAAQAIRELNLTENKEITIKTYEQEGYVYCEIEDNGPGMPEEVKRKIFDPFFTTKEPGKGTGLGLNIAYDIVTNKHNGELLVESEVGTGTKFVIKLPVE